MNIHLATNNLYRYATSELSQDAFICWLVSHLLEENINKDKYLTACARDMLELFGSPIPEGTYLLDVKKQYDKIDVLLITPTKYVIVEDKTFTNVHDDQINRYKACLKEKLSIDEQDIICVYYKIIEQPAIEDSVDINITRDVLLEIMRPYRNRTTNTIFTDYVDYLEYIDAKTKIYQILPIEQWDGYAYRGFFKAIGENPKSWGISSEINWAYVSNPNGGFWGLWWRGPVNDNSLESTNLKKKRIENLYLQIENDKLAVKLAVKDNFDKHIVSDIRWRIFNYFHNKLGEEFYKGVFRYGKYMTVGSINYHTLDDFKQKVALLETIMHDMLLEIFF